VAQEPPQGPTAVNVTDEALRLRVSIDLSEFGNRVQNEAVRLYADYAQRGLTGEALADAVTADLESIFDVSIDRAGREATHEAFNLGRNLEAQARRTQIGDVVRTEILDENTCDPCRGLDGNVYTLNSPSYFDDMPPNHCEGGEQCRGFYLYRSAA
jgi:hypothetical protein